MDELDKVWSYCFRVRVPMAQELFEFFFQVR